MSRATLDAREAHERVWDALVIGAGPAGALAARELARQGHAVLLVDRESFPREKVCGCCLNASALSTLDAVGMGALAERHGAAAVREVVLAGRGRRAVLHLPAMQALSRVVLDDALAGEAIAAGTAFLDRTRARVRGISFGDCETLLNHDAKVIVRSRIVLAASGLGAPPLDSGIKGLEQTVRHDSHVGCGARVASDAAYPPGRLTMAIGAAGYTGLVRVEDGTLNIAAAVSPERLRAAGGMAQAVDELLAEARLPRVPELAAAAWRGTPPLTRRCSPWVREGLLLLGDAAGYVEPFTGEGMAWALAGARSAARWAGKALRRSGPDLLLEWEHAGRLMLRSKQLRCQAISRVLRRPRCVGAALWAIEMWPRLGEIFVRSMHQEPGSARLYAGRAA